MRVVQCVCLMASFLFLTGTLIAVANDAELGAGLFGGASALCVLIGWALEFWPHEKTVTVKKLSIPHDYFMPYSVCPKCKTEALHWMESAQVDVNDRVLRACRECEHTWMQTVGPDKLLKEAA